MLAKCLDSFNEEGHIEAYGGLYFQFIGVYKDVVLLIFRIGAVLVPILDDLIGEVLAL